MRIEVDVMKRLFPCLFVDVQLVKTERLSNDEFDGFPISSTATAPPDREEEQSVKEVEASMKKTLSLERMIDMAPPFPSSVLQ